MVEGSSGNLEATAPVGCMLLARLSSIISFLIPSIVPCFVRTAYIPVSVSHIVGILLSKWNPYHHQIRKLLVPSRAFGDRLSVIRVMWNDVDCDFGGSKVLYIGLVRLVGVCKIPGLLDRVGGGAQQDRELWTSGLAVRHTIFVSRREHTGVVSFTFNIAAWSCKSLMLGNRGRRDSGGRTLPFE